MISAEDLAKMLLSGQLQSNTLAALKDLSQKLGVTASLEAAEGGGESHPANDCTTLTAPAPSCDSATLPRPGGGAPMDPSGTPATGSPASRAVRCPGLIEVNMAHHGAALDHIVKAPQGLQGLPSDYEALPPPAMALPPQAFCPPLGSLKAMHGGSAPCSPQGSPPSPPAIVVGGPAGTARLSMMLDDVLDGIEGGADSGFQNGPAAAAATTISAPAAPQTPALQGLESWSLQQLLLPQHVDSPRSQPQPLPQLQLKPQPPPQLQPQPQHHFQPKVAPQPWPQPQPQSQHQHLPQPQPSVQPQYQHQPQPQPSLHPQPQTKPQVLAYPPHEGAYPAAYGEYGSRAGYGHDSTTFEASSSQRGYSSQESEGSGYTEDYQQQQQPPCGEASWEQFLQMDNDNLFDAVPPSAGPFMTATAPPAPFPATQSPTPHVPSAQQYAPMQQTLPSGCSYASAPALPSAVVGPTPGPCGHAHWAPNHSGPQLAARDSHGAVGYASGPPAPAPAQGPPQYAPVYSADSPGYPRSAPQLAAPTPAPASSPRTLHCGAGAQGQFQGLRLPPLAVPHAHSVTSGLPLHHGHNCGTSAPAPATPANPGSPRSLSYPAYAHASSGANQSGNAPAGQYPQFPSHCASSQQPQVQHALPQHPQYQHPPSQHPVLQHQPPQPPPPQRLVQHPLHQQFPALQAPAQQTASHWAGPSVHSAQQQQLQQQQQPVVPPEPNGYAGQSWSKPAATEASPALPGIHISGSSLAPQPGKNGLQVCVPPGPAPATPSPANGPAPCTGPGVVAPRGVASSDGCPASDPASGNHGCATKQVPAPSGPMDVVKGTESAVESPSKGEQAAGTGGALGKAALSAPAASGKAVEGKKGARETQTQASDAAAAALQEYRERMVARQKRGMAMDNQSVAARKRRAVISQGVKRLQAVIPGGKNLDTGRVLDRSVEYVMFLEQQLLTLAQEKGTAILATFESAQDKDAQCTKEEAEKEQGDAGEVEIGDGVADF